MPSTKLDVAVESWPLAEAFVISRGTKTAADVVVVTLSDDGVMGRGEAVPYARYGESVLGVVDAIKSVGPVIDRERLKDLLPAGAARNALDCAIWDLEAKQSGVRAADRAGRTRVEAILTAFTISLGAPSKMAADAARAAELPLLKLKLGGEGDAERIAAVRAARPDARIICDANEAWTTDLLESGLAAAQAAHVELIEQPLPAGADDALGLAGSRGVPICADESVHTLQDLEALAGRYDAVNIKLDKTGGLTHALEMQSGASQLGLKVMVGSMVATSLAVAPALVLAQDADWVDLDGPLLLARDREDGLVIENGRITPADVALWG